MPPRDWRGVGGQINIGASAKGIGVRAGAKSLSRGHDAAPLMADMCHADAAQCCVSCSVAARWRPAACVMKSLIVCSCSSVNVA